MTLEYEIMIYTVSCELLANLAFGADDPIILICVQLLDVQLSGLGFSDGE